MGFLKNVFNSVMGINSKPVILKRLGTPPTFSPARAGRGNYFRYASGPAETVVTGREFVIPVSTILGTKKTVLSVNHPVTAGTFAITITYNGGSVTISNIAFDITASDLQALIRGMSGDLNFIHVLTALAANQNIAIEWIGIQTLTSAVLDISGLTGPTVVTSLISYKGDWGPIKRGDRVIFEDASILTVENSTEMNDLGGDILGYRCTME